MTIWLNIYKGLAYIGLERPSNFYMVEYSEIFKIAFFEILDFLRRLKIRFKAPTKYK